MGAETLPSSRTKVDLIIECWKIKIMATSAFHANLLRKWENLGLKCKSKQQKWTAPVSGNGLIPVSLSVCSVSFEQIAVLHKRFKQLSHNEEMLRWVRYVSFKMMTNLPHYLMWVRRLSSELSFHPFLEPVWQAVALNIRCATCNHCLTPSCHSLKMPFMPLGGNISRQSQTWPATPSAPRSSRPSSTEGVALAVRPGLGCCSSAAQTCENFLHFHRNFHQNDNGTVEEISFEEFLVVMSHFRPPSEHMTEEQRESVRKEKLRCVCPQRRAHACHYLNSHPSELTAVCLSACSFIQHARHRQWWDDNAGGVQTRESLLAHETLFTLTFPVWTRHYWFTVNKYTNNRTLEAFGTAGETGNKQMKVNSNYQN